ncbi:peptidoglycan-binding protein [Bacillus thuringiensis]|uniref:peptidoglycan-binding protein n=1 Tax=Bacillus thuringiensis TaxID=1428 RepID=UPI000BF28B33|nr:peptidoglycan-binding protein [Bacillus thuringiensis]PFP10205.1 peptidase M15 [Bacillus thuringiensis]PGP47934.1 peptidase M15 [Bacillus thuringiensis]PGY60125.1 peptidase M15 [Bacillus thuringiensis]
MENLPTLKLGSTGYYVTVLQLNLIGLGVNYEKLTITGFFDEKTNKYTKIFQEKTKLKPNGIVEVNTWKSLFENVILIQKKLQSIGIYFGQLDGIFGVSTIEATQEYQIRQNLYPSGNITPRTRHKLFNPNSQSESYTSSNHLHSLHPYVEMLAKEFLQLTKANGLDVRIYAVFRSWSEQDQLFSLGRWKPGKKVTNARGGESYHNWGLAFDAAPYENNSIPWGDIKKFKQMGYIGEKLGLTWGGRFTTIVDYPHFEYSFGLSSWDLLNGITPPILNI